VGYYVYQGVVADGGDLRTTADGVGEELALEGLGVAEGCAVYGQDEVALAEAGLGRGAAGDDLDHAERTALVEALGQLGSQGCGRRHQPQVRTAYAAVMQQ
jgi:hypothetical protein